MPASFVLSGSVFYRWVAVLRPAVLYRFYILWFCSGSASCGSVAVLRPVIL